MKNYLHYIIALLAGLLILLLLPAANGLTDLGVRATAVIVPVLYLWLTTNTHWTAVFALALLILTKAASPNQIWAASFGHFVIPTIIVFMILNECLRQTGVIHKIAHWFITRPIVKGRPLVFLSMFMASGMIIGQFMENLSLAIIYIGIAAALCEEMGYQKGDPFYTAMFMSVLWPNIVYAISSPIAHALPNILIGVVQSSTGIQITYGQWLAVGLPFAAIMYGVMVLIMRIWNPDSRKFKNFDMETPKTPPLSTEGKIASAVFLMVIAAVLLPEFLKGVFPTAAGIISGWGVAVPAIFGIALLSIIQIKGKPVMDFPLCAKSIPIPAVIFAGSVNCLAPIISSESTGISAWIGNSLQPVFAGLPSFLLVVMLIILSVLMTNFLSNVVTMVLFFNLGAALLTAGNYNLAAFAVIIALAASMSAATPSASVPSPLFFGPGHLTMKSTLKWNVLFVLSAIVLLVAVAVPLANQFLPH